MEQKQWYKELFSDADTAEKMTAEFVEELENKCFSTLVLS